MKRKLKGEFGYIEYKRNMTILKTILLYLTAVIIFYIGYHEIGKKENLFTVVAVLDLLPASRSLVSTIMYIKVPKFSEDFYKGVQSIIDQTDVKILYNLYLTSYKNNFALESVAVRGNNVIGLAVKDKCDINLCQTHIIDYAKKNNLSNITVKIFDDYKKYEERVSQLNNLEASKKEQDIVNLLLDLSL